MPQLRAVFRLLRPWPQHRRKTSFIFRMDNLAAGICASFLSTKKDAGYRGLSASTARYGYPVRGWQASLEPVAAFAWNGWQLCRGIGGRLGPEYAIIVGGWERSNEDVGHFEIKLDLPTQTSNSNEDDDDDQEDD
jgi:hypothetical protein